jgi:rhomboid domain-containing protein 1
MSAVARSAQGTPLDGAPLATTAVVIAVAISFALALAANGDFARVCASPRLAFEHPLSSYHRVWTSTFSHGSFPHALLNCLAFVPMASALERSIGTTHFAWLFATFAHAAYALSASAATALWMALGYRASYESCAIGMSGVVFALIVCETNVNDVERRSVFGLFTVSSEYYPIALLLFIQLLMPGVSFIGHAGGIAAGWLYVRGYLNFLLLKETHVEYLEKLAICAPARALASFVPSNADRGARPNAEASSTAFPAFSTVRAIPTRVSEVTRNAFAGTFPGQGRKLGGDGSTTGEMANLVRVDPRALDTLVELGFAEHAARRALQECDGDSQRAIELLTESAAHDANSDEIV